jgi:hypothetical protein
MTPYLISLFVGTFLGIGTLVGQTVKFIKNPLQAKYRVFVTSKPEEANLFAGLWYIVENPMLFKDAMTVFQVKTKDEADLIVYYTDDKKKAGYKK